MNENYVRIGGGLTRDPNFSTTQYGGQMAGLTVAVNGARYDSKQKQQVVTTEYVSVIAFGFIAEQVIEMGLSRGDTVVVEGAISQQEVEGPDGTKDRKTRVQAWAVRPVSVRASRAPSGPPPSGSGDGWSQRPPSQPPGGGGGAFPPPHDEPPF